MNNIIDNVGFFNRSTFTNGNEILHDFRKCTARWGWNGLSLEHCKDRHHKMRGIGRGIKAGDVIITDYSLPDAESCGYKVIQIYYHWNPKDMFDALIEGPFALSDGALKQLSEM